MKKGGGKKKGSENERRLCKILSKWWTGKDKPIVFWRVGSSGAQFTISSGTTEMSGDVVAVHQDGFSLTNIFSIETKFVKYFDLIDLFYPLKKTNQVYSWWKQCIGDAEKVNKKPLLIFRRNRSEYFFMMEYNENLKKYLFDFMIFKDKTIIGKLKDLINIPPKYIVVLFS